MIKNIIFDVGNVLVDFNWEKQFHELGFEGETYQAVAKATVLSDTWNEYDRGALSDDEILSRFLKAAPGYEKEIMKLWDNIGTSIHQFDYSLNWIKSLKSAGYHIYILSNYSKRTYEKTREELSFELFTDGAIFSFMVKEVKPEAKIYHLLLEKYNLLPDECVFLDDRKENLKIPEALGICTICFTTKEHAVEEMHKIGINI